MNRQTIFVREQQVKELLSLSEAISAVETAFRDKAEGYAIMPPKFNLPLPSGDFRTMPAYLSKQNIAGVKIVNVHPNNPSKGLPTVMATLVLLEPETGFPLAVMEASYLTAIRTAAVGALSIRTLAPKNATTLGLIGAGVQGRFQILAAKEAMPNLKLIKVWSRDENLAWQLKNELEQKIGVLIQVHDSVEEAVRDAQVVVTATPSRTPIVHNEWVKDGIHITCIGADAYGKQELDPAILKRARIFLDDMVQGMESGEVNVPLQRGILMSKDIAGELSDVLVGRKEGRISDETITVFSSTGLAIQDICCGNVVLRKMGIR